MSSYFSQLIQQTGIALPTGNVRAGDVLPDIVNVQSSEEGALIQEEHREVMVPQPEPSVFPVTHSDQERQEVDHPIVRETITDTPDNTLVSKVVQPDHPPKLSGEGEQPVIASGTAQGAIADSPEPESTILEQIEVPFFSESIPISQASEQQKTGRNRSTLTNSSLQVAHQPLDPLEQQANVTEPKPIESMQIDRKVEAARKAETHTDALQTRQAYLQAVRDWVAPMPGEIKELQDAYIEQQPQQQLSSSQKPARVAVSPHQQPVSERFSLEQTSQSEHQKPEEQDFVLSIGSIHLTIETPQQDTLPPPVLQSQAEPNVKTDYQASRLSRYYLKLR